MSYPGTETTPIVYTTVRRMARKLKRSSKKIWVFLRRPRLQGDHALALTGPVHGGSIGRRPSRGTMESAQRP